MSMSPPEAIIQRLATLSDTYVETGTYFGDSALLALRCGFKAVNSIELSEACHLVAKERCTDPAILLFLGDSAKVLPKILAKLDHAAVIFLDAHNTSELAETAKGSETDGWLLSPLRKELQAIVDAPVKNHIIAIDDVDGSGKPELENVTVEEITAFLKLTGTSYHVELVDGNREKSLLLAIPA
jgi:hypothetical protein